MNPVQASKFITYCLSPFTNETQQNYLHQLIVTKEIDWKQIIQITSQHLVTPSLYSSLKHKQLLPDCPADVHEYLNTIFHLNEQRNKALSKQLLNISNYLSEVNVTPVMLKGSASLATNLYMYPAERVMRDLDLLIDRQLLHTAVKQLFTHGYHYCQLDSQATVPADANEDPIESLVNRGCGFYHHIFPIEHTQEIASVELHFELTPQLTRIPLLTAEECLAHAVKTDIKNLRVLCIEHRLLHNFFHTQITDKNGYLGKINLLQIYEFTQLIHQYQNHIDWKLIINKLKLTGLDHQFIAYLKLSSDYFECPLPDIYTSSLRSRVIVYHHRIVSRHHIIGMIDGLIIFLSAKLMRELSPIRVRNNHADTILAIAYIKQLAGIPRRLFRLGWLKENWRQFIDAIRHQ